MSPSPTEPEPLRAGEQFWRESNQMRVLNTDLAKQHGATKIGARLWRLRPGQASTQHRHLGEEELYVLLEGSGRIRVGEHLHTLGPMDTLVVAPELVRQIFNDTDADAVWLVAGAPPEFANTLEMSAETIATMYPQGMRALPPELGGGEFVPPAAG